MEKVVQSLVNKIEKKIVGSEVFQDFSDTLNRKINEYGNNAGKPNKVLYKSSMSDYSSTASNSPYGSTYYVPDQLQMNGNYYVNQSPVQNFNQMPNNIQILNQNYCPMPQPDLNYKPPNPNINFQNNLINESLDAVVKQMLEPYLFGNNQQIPGQVVPKQQHPTHHRHQEDPTKVKKNHFVNEPPVQYNKQVQQQQQQKPKPRNPLQESEPQKQWKHFDTIYSDLQTPQKQWKHFDTIYDDLHSPEDEEPQKQWKHFNTIYNDLQSSK